MTPWTLLDTAPIPEGGGRLRLLRRGSEFVIRIDDGTELMSSRLGGSEESLARLAAERGVSQYVLLGAGLDTFALRNETTQLRVFEVDHPATQRWKNRLLLQAGLDMPATCTKVAVNFEQDDLESCLKDAGLQPDEPALFAMLGVVPYLTPTAFAATLAVVGAHRADAWLALDYSLPRDLLPPPEQLAFDSLAQRVQQAGEPFRLFLSSDDMAQRLRAAGFRVQEELTPEAINERYFAARASTLRVRGSGARLLLATRETPV